MTEQELSTERLIFAALLKAASEQATYLTGTMKMQMKYNFNNLVKQMDDFVKSIEKQMEGKPEGSAYFEKITDIYHNFNIDLRRNLNDEYRNAKGNPETAGADLTQV